MLRAGLDRLYTACAALACVFLASIAALVILQVVTRMAGVLVVGLIDYATYAMVAATFLGLAPTLRRGVHIRVTLLIGVLTGAPRRLLEILALGVASAVMLYLGWFAVLLAWDSWAFGYRAMGLAATPLWIPQGGMALGALVAAIAFVDELIGVLSGRVPSYAGPSNDPQIAPAPPAH